MAQLPVDQREDFMAIEALRQGVVGQEMPGLMPGMGMLDDPPPELGDEEEDEEGVDLPVWVVTIARDYRLLTFQSRYLSAFCRDS